MNSTSKAEAHQVLDTLAQEENASRADGSEKRRATRKSVRIEALITPLLESAMSVDPIRIHVRDLSMTGMGFMCAVPIPPGTLWRMSLLVEHHTLGQQAFTVRHCRAISNNVCMVGAQFCVDPTLIRLVGLKLADMAVLRSPDDHYDVDFVSPDCLP